MLFTSPVSGHNGIPDQCIFTVLRLSLGKKITKDTPVHSQLQPHWQASFLQKLFKNCKSIHSVMSFIFGSQVGNMLYGSNLRATGLGALWQNRRVKSYKCIKKVKLLVISDHCRLTR